MKQFNMTNSCWLESYEALRNIGHYTNAFYLIIYFVCPSSLIHLIKNRLFLVEIIESANLPLLGLLICNEKIRLFGKQLNILFSSIF